MFGWGIFGGYFELRGILIMEYKINEADTAFIFKFEIINTECLIPDCKYYSVT